MSALMGSQTRSYEPECRIHVFRVYVGGRAELVSLDNILQTSNPRHFTAIVQEQGTLTCVLY